MIRMEMAVSFNAAEAAKIENCAALMNMSALEFVRGAVLARVEHETAFRDAKTIAAVDAAIESLRESKGTPLTSEDMPQLLDRIADVRVEQIAAERLSKPMGKGISFDEMLAKCGLTQADLDAVPEDEIE